MQLLVPKFNTAIKPDILEIWMFQQSLQNGAVVLCGHPTSFRRVREHELDVILTVIPHALAVDIRTYFDISFFHLSCADTCSRTFKNQHQHIQMIVSKEYCLLTARRSNLQAPLCRRAKFACVITISGNAHHRSSKFTSIRIDCTEEGTCAFHRPETQAYIQTEALAVCCGLYRSPRQRQRKQSKRTNTGSQSQLEQLKADHPTLSNRKLNMTTIWILCFPTVGSSIVVLVPLLA